MTIANEITKLNTNLTNSYTACQNKGAIIPTDQNFDNLATCINTIQTGGGGSTLITKTITQNGTYNASSDNADGYSQVTVNVSGGGGDSGGKYLVRVIDYDGTILKEDHLNTGATFTLPTPPTHSKLTFIDWSSPVTITNNTVTITDSDITIGPLYNTNSELSEFDIKLNEKTGLTVTLGGSAYLVDWGDGTSDSTLSHTYADYGSYTITCAIETIPNSMFKSKTFLFEARLGGMVTEIEGEAFRDAVNLSAVSLPFDLTRVGTYVFSGTGLHAAIIPPRLSVMNDRMFQTAYLLKNIVIPYGVTQLNQYCIYGGVLDSITFPNTVTTLGSYCLNYATNIKRMTLPNSMTNVGSRATGVYYNLEYGKINGGITSFNTSNVIFYNGKYIKEYDFTAYTSVPTLSSTTALTINNFAVIKVPSSLAAAWKTASNWSTYASNIIGV